MVTHRSKLFVVCVCLGGGGGGHVLSQRSNIGYDFCGCESNYVRGTRIEYEG